MSVISKTKRRSFLKLGVGGIATGAVAPFVWVPKISKAALEIPSDKSNQLCVINLDGGARSAPMFNGNLDGMWNPYGVLGTPVEWGVGAVFTDTPYQETVALGMPEVPSIGTVANEMAVIATMDHTPGAAAGVGNHNTARNWISSGHEMGGAGIFSEIYRLQKRYTLGSEGLVFPPVVIGGGDATRPFANPSGTIEPVTTDSYLEFASQSGDNGGAQPDWARAMEGGLDGHFAGSRSARDFERITRLANGKENVEAFRDVFTSPVLKVAAEPTAMSHSLTNQQLEAIFGATDFGRDAALATRFLGQGSVATLISRNGWDTHSNAMPVYEMMANEVARVICGFSYALKLMPHPEGGTIWDHTVICCISEFARDNVMGSGYNSGGGSDHVGGPGSRYQAYFMMGGPITQGGRKFGTTNPSSMEREDDGTPLYGTQDYLASLLAYLDIDYTQVFPSATCFSDPF